jgi:hypothetical protein
VEGHVHPTSTVSAFVELYHVIATLHCSLP